MIAAIVESAALATLLLGMLMVIARICIERQLGLRATYMVFLVHFGRKVVIGIHNFRTRLLISRIVVTRSS